jgi:ribosomal protein L11 methyltransferase
MTHYPQKTHELRVEMSSKTPDECFAVKQTLFDFLTDKGIDSYVEGVIDNVDIDNEPGGPERDFYKELGGVHAPVSIYKYDLESLQGLSVELEKKFGDKIKISFHSMDTEVWMEGWKESFRPFETNAFRVFPPWESSASQNKIPICIEPGMAFGTGQHATTKLCLEGIEEFAMTYQTHLHGAVLDVGTGTGILAIAAYKLGCRDITATDIDADAILACERNFRDNNVVINSLLQSTVPSGKSYDIVIANILPMVLRVIMKDLCSAVKSGGFLMLSGLLSEQELELKTLAESFGLTYVKNSQKEGWSRLLLRNNQ